MPAVINTAKSIDAQCAELAQILGLSEPVSVKVLTAAVQDPVYAQNLLISRSEPRFLQRLLANPPLMTDNHTPQPDLPTTTLVANAARSLGRWAAAGFTAVSDACYAARLAACQDCPYLRRPSVNQQALYAVVGAKPDERAICGKCGCVISTKARRPKDTCPESHPERPGFNRWNEPHVAQHSAPIVRS